MFRSSNEAERYLSAVLMNNTFICLEEKAVSFPRVQLSGTVLPFCPTTCTCSLVPLLTLRRIAAITPSLEREWGGRVFFKRSSTTAGLEAIQLALQNLFRLRPEQKVVILRDSSGAL